MPGHTGRHVRELAALPASRGHARPLRESGRHAYLKVLVMGCSWAPFLAHSTLLAMLDQAHGPTAELSRMVYGAPTPQLATDEDIVSWAYIDDYGVAGVGLRAEGVPERLSSWAKRTKQVCLAAGVPVHKEQKGVGVEAFGAALQTVPFRVGLPCTKAVNLLIATEFILEGRLVTVKVIERILVLWGWAMLFARPALAIVDKRYHFMRETSTAGLVHLPAWCVCRIRVVASSSAQHRSPPSWPRTYPLHGARWRLRRAHPQRAMSSAAQTYPPSLCRALTRCIIASAVQESMLSSRQGIDRLSFSLVPLGRSRPERRRGERVLAPLSRSRVDRRRLLYCGLWRKPEHINVQELRTLVGLARHLSRSSSCWDSLYLVLVDSIVALGAASKGRSSAGALLRLCRPMIPINLVLNIRMLSRYIPSELNPSDGPSRGLGVGPAPETREAHRDRWAAPEASSSPWQLPPSSKASRPLGGHPWARPRW